VRRRAKCSTSAGMSSFPGTLASPANTPAQDGDGASSTKLYAQRSALPKLPTHQGVAVTKSVNQIR
jgi:predicted ATP-dependent protease